VAVGVAAGGDDRGAPVVIGAGEHLGTAGGVHGVHGHLDVPADRILESHRHGQPAGHLAVDRAPGGPGADGAPAHGVGQIPGDDRVEELTPHRQPEGQDVPEEGAGHRDPLVDPEGAVQTGVGEQTLPAHRGPGLFEVGPHDDDQLVAQAVRQAGQPLGVATAGDRIVDGARSHHDDQTVVVTVEDGPDRLPSAGHHLRLPGGEGKSAYDLPRGLKRAAGRLRSMRCRRFGVHGVGVLPARRSILRMTGVPRGWGQNKRQRLSPLPAAGTR